MVSVYPLCGSVTLGDGEGGVGMEVPQSEKEEESLITPAGCGLRQEQIESPGATLPSSAHSYGDWRVINELCQGPGT